MNEATTNINTEVDTTVLDINNVASLPLLLLEDTEVEVLLQKMTSEDTNVYRRVSKSLVSPLEEDDGSSLISSSEDEEDGSLCSIGEDFFRIEDDKIINSRDSDDELWNRSYKGLVDYKKVHKHCNVPRAHKTLGSWVKRQREFIKLHQGKVGVCCSLSMYRYNKLVSLGLQSTLGKGINTSQWEQRYEELLSFHTENGHCDVLTTRKGFGSMGMHTAFCLCQEVQRRYESLPRSPKAI